MIGDNTATQGELGRIIKKVGDKKDKDSYVVFLVFDLREGQIYFSRPEPFSKQSVYEYNYLGNNPGASMQYHLSRELTSLGYLLGTVFSDLLLMLKKHGQENSELAKIILQLKEAGLISTQDKQGQGTVNLNRLRVYSNNNYTGVELKRDKKALIFSSDNNEPKRYSYEQLLRNDLDDNNKRNAYILVIPVVQTEDEQFIILSKHPDYVELIKQEKFGEASPKVKKNSMGKVCHLCGQVAEDVTHKYSAKFDQSKINKIFTTTTINTAPSFNKQDYDRVYGLCNSCYNRLLAGENVVKERFHGQIANESAYIIPESLLANFDYDNLVRIKYGIDFAFKTASAEEWLKGIKAEIGLMEQAFYTVNFIIYRTDGKSVTVLQSIEDVPTLRFTRIIRSIARNWDRLSGHLRHMSIGSIYGLIPVRVNKKGEQIDIGRVLTLYKVLLSGGVIDKVTLFSYAVEALDKGMRQLAKSEIDNYLNMQLFNYRRGKEDFFIKKIIMSYLVLFHTCQEFSLLNNTEFMNGESGGSYMIASFSERIDKSISRTEEFLNQEGFKKEARALFYLGAMVYRVAIAQLLKEHRTKPVLKKINFQGMNQRDVNRLYFEVVEKLRQYDRLTLFAEALMNRFHYYAGTIGDNWPLSEHANVFYIMAGYAYMVGSKPEDVTKEEKQLIIESEEEEAV
ncbi:MAG: CRISPR-associated protein [Syntrophomonadaceae bacterium]|nr:CRISPR-associated protein [Syntrophomonadaceae bacterium]